MPRHLCVCVCLYACDRVGLRVLLPRAFSAIRWFGRGPHENYPDRKASTVVTRHASSVAEQLTPYIRPGECGGKADVRWLEVSRPTQDRVPPAAAAAGTGGVSDAAAPASSSGVGEPAILFAVPAATTTASREQGDGDASGQQQQQQQQADSSPSLFSFSALPHLAEDLAGAMHPEQLLPRPVTAVSLDHRIMGVGGDDSWSACVHDEYLVRPGRFRFSFALAPFWRRRPAADDGGGCEDDGGEQASQLWRSLRQKKEL